MIDFNLEKMLYCIPTEKHDKEQIIEILRDHPEVKFVSFVGIDIGGHDTDEKIPTKAFIEDMETLLDQGVQTDGSSVVLPKIAKLNNAKVDIIPDCHANWYVDHNFRHSDPETGLPVGTLRIPSFLKHNDEEEVGSRVILRDSIQTFKKHLLALMKDHPYVFENLDIDGVEDIESIELTAATELEFWVKTPDEEADRREELFTAQLLKEQYWKRTVGPVRTALEKSLMILDYYGFEVEMGHKEVGGVKAKMREKGDYDHVMEQLEIDWKYTSALQAADNENQVKYVIRDVFRMHGLDVTFMAKPLDKIAGSGEHTHMGVAARLKSGKIVNLFSPKDVQEDYLSPIGFGALLGLLNNYDVVNPFISATNDAFNRLKPGYEAPVCVVTSLGHDVNSSSRNRTVLAGLIRDQKNKLATRFELRSPNPKSNTYLVLGASYMAMLDGIQAALKNGKTSKDLEKSISKEWGQEDFYLEKYRIYRSEEDVFEAYTAADRDRLFGRIPRTVWENLCAFDDKKEKVGIYALDNVMSPLTIESYKEAILGQWTTELQNRIVPNIMEEIRRSKKIHRELESVDYDVAYWGKIDKLRNELGRNELNKECVLTRLIKALERKDYETASAIQIETQERFNELHRLYIAYKKNLF